MTVVEGEPIIGCLKSLTISGIETEWELYVSVVNKRLDVNSGGSRIFERWVIPLRAALYV